MPDITREQWLINCAESIIPRIKDVTAKDMPNFRISCGWPSKRGLSSKKRVIGECWAPVVSADNSLNLFISPMLHQKMEVAATVAHELVHGNVGNEHKHKKPFWDVAKDIGLEGKPTATVAGPTFKEFMDPILDKLGPYPHAAINLSSLPKVQKTALLKVGCAACGYVIRVTHKWIEKGLPYCSCNMEQMVEML
jgi:hypothetical protein